MGLLALKEQAYADGEPYPLDILDPQTEDMIGYIVVQEWGNVLPQDRCRHRWDAGGRLARLA